MLLIYWALPLGGIETFFVRMAKARSNLGKLTRILLIGPRGASDSQLLTEMQKHAEIVFLEDYINCPEKIYAFVKHHLILFLPLNANRLKFIFRDIDHVHVSSSMFGLFYIKLAVRLNIYIPLTIGVYHSREFIWGGGRLPFYERMNRKLFFQGLPRRNLIFFNDKLVERYWKDRKGVGVNIFPLGVIESSALAERNQNEIFTIGSIGRLVSFKSYNIWMIEVVKKLKAQGVKVRYVVYGDGPLRGEMQNKIDSYGLQNQICLKGNLQYADFSKAVKQFDIFVGSGTAIIEAASSGVPSIIGIEAVTEASTYGFLADIPGFTYNEDNLYPKVNSLDLILNYLNSSNDDKLKLKLKHIEKAKLFSINECVKNFESIEPEYLNLKFAKENSGFWFGLLYTCSFISFALLSRLKGKSLTDTVYG